MKLILKQKYAKTKLCNEKRKHSLDRIGKWYLWVLEPKHDGYIVTRNKIKSYALILAKPDQHESQVFKATLVWCSRFMIKEYLLIRRKTKSLKTFLETFTIVLRNFIDLLLGRGKDTSFPCDVLEIWMRPH